MPQPVRLSGSLYEIFATKTVTNIGQYCPLPAKPLQYSHLNHLFKTMKRFHACYLLPFALGTFSGAYAQMPEAAACTKIKNNHKRLKCFDRLYAEAAAAKPAGNITAAVSQPEENTEKSVLDLEQTYLASKENRSPQLVFAEKVFPPSPQDITPLSKLYDLDENSTDGLLSIREHNPMYIMPAWYNSSPNYRPHSPTRGTADNPAQKQQKRLETKMQISFKTKLMEDVFKTRADLWFGYTQQSNWQIYNQGNKSAPFRNTDYAPELFLTQPVKADLPFGGKLRMLGAGIVHQSNGQSRPLSRSWNRAYVTAGIEWKKLSIMPRWWLRLDKKGEHDDNPDIGRYMGYGDLKLAYRFNDRQSLTSTLRYNPRRGRGAVQVDYAFPIKGKLKAYVQGFHGYGENLIDYNHKQTGLGIGLMLQDWDGI